MKRITSTIFLLTFVMSVLLAQSDPLGKEGKTEMPEFSRSNLQSITRIELYPNPTSDFITVTIDREKLKSVEFEMYNIIGNHMNIAMEQEDYRQFKINVREYNPGYYLLVVKDPITRYNQVVKFQKK
jgi:hypothetical protein